ncbi:MAG: class I SAM-dependent methyltransferase [Bacteroidetes bacterium]|nr:class I SAM-dependent methyltransferase [Bacteroidota bacterium]
MKIPVFQIINYSLIILVVILFVRYLWDVIFNPNYQPPGWRNARKEGRLSRTLLKLEKNYPDKVRFFNFWFQVERLKKEQVPGAFAELGVYQGESARVLHHMDPERRLHLFDTFEGFKNQDLAVEKGEAATYTTSNFADTRISKVLATIAGNKNISVQPGHFPGSALKVVHEKFALVNIDADLYNPTKAGLEFFYPRLSPGGVIMVHDYNYKWEGVVKAVDDFCKTVPEAMVVLPDMETTAMIIRRKF